MKYGLRNLMEGEYSSRQSAYSSIGYGEYIHDRSLFPYFLVLFLISPALALISGIASFRRRGARLICLFFMGAYGYSIILNPGMDSHSMGRQFIEIFSLISHEVFVQNMISILSLKGSIFGTDEPLWPVLAYSLAQFTASTNVLFLVLGIIYGFFFLKAVSIVFDEIDRNWNIVVAILFFFFISWVGLYGINAVRTYIGGWILFYGAFLYIKTQNYKYILLVMLSPLAHFAYMAMILPFFVYVFMRDLKYVYAAVLLVSFFATAGLNLFEPVLSATELGQEKTKYYTGENWEARSGGSFAQEKSFHAQYYRTAGRWAINIMFIGSILFAGYLTGKHHDHLQTGLGSVAILLLSFSNFTTVIPALSGRTFTNFGLFALAYLVRLYSRRSEKLKEFHWIIYLCLPAILLFLFTQYSRVGDYMDFRVLVSPLFYPFLGDDPVSIKEFLRSILDL